MSAGASSVVERLALGGEAFALCTVHRAENTDDPQSCCARSCSAE
jgi:hypothetical protein